MHGLITLLIVRLVFKFGAMFGTGRGHGAILHWLPTGFATEIIRRKGNEEWIRRLPDIIVSPGPSYNSYYVTASPQDRYTQRQITAMLRREGYTVTENLASDSCEIVVLSPFVDDKQLRGTLAPRDHMPVIYVLARSIRLRGNASIAIQWIDFRRPAREQFWKQSEKKFSNLSGKQPVFPYVPETLSRPILPAQYGSGVLFIMSILALSSALLVSSVGYLVLRRNSTSDWSLPTSGALLVTAISLVYFVAAQMLCGVISPLRARRWLEFAAVLTTISALTSLSLLFVMCSFAVVLVDLFLVGKAQPSLSHWLHARSKSHGARNQLRPVSYFRIFTSYQYVNLMVLLFLGVNAGITNLLIVPRIPQRPSTAPYAVSVPGPYSLLIWDYGPKTAIPMVLAFTSRIIQTRLRYPRMPKRAIRLGYKFSGVDAFPMRFAPHFQSSVHVRFTNDDVRTDFGFVVNDIAGEVVGPQVRLSASGSWLVVDSHGKIYSGQIPAMGMLKTMSLRWR